MSGTTLGSHARIGALVLLLALAGACGDGGGGGGAGENGGGGDRDDRASATTLPKGECTEDEKFDEGDDHVSKPKYDVNPPAGGPHDPVAAPPRIYGEDPPADGTLVHALEHGDIVVWHQPDLAAADVDALSKLAREYPRHVLLVERDSMDVPVAATAWQRRLLCTGLDTERLATWIEENRNKGPEGFVD